ncbi:MAG TPA: hypothetical protein VGH33_03085 [Isosphaeraceae bacterium]|jgi:hypothetical protein
MVIADTLAGIIDSWLTFHYDIGNDVLYFARSGCRLRETFGEETPDGLILHRDAETDEVIKWTSISWWKRFGDGPLPDSMSELARRIEAWSRTLPVEVPTPSA